MIIWCRSVMLSEERNGFLLSQTLCFTAILVGNRLNSSTSLDPKWGTGNQRNAMGCCLRIPERIFPQALLNFIALLGWNPGDDREVLSLEEMVDEFHLEGVRPEQFLTWKTELMNQQYLLKLPEEYFRMIDDVIQKGLPWSDPGKIRQAAKS